MKKELLILILLFAYIGNALAQRDYRKGYIVTNNRDTVFGWIDYRGDIRNSKVCSFRESESDKATEYAPGDIAEYRFIDSKYYVSRDIGTEYESKTVFLEFLVNGMANLYYYCDNNAEGHYYIEKDDNFVELKTVEREAIVANELGTKALKSYTIKSYIGTLKATLDVWEMGDEIDKAKLEHRSLINIAKNYHQYACMDGSECVVYEKKKTLVAFRIAPVVGVNLSTFRLVNPYVENYNFDPSTNLTIGLNLNISLPRINEKFFLQMQAMYTKYYFFGTYNSSPNSISSASSDVHFRTNVLQTGLAVKYEYPKGKWRPTLATGVSFIYLPDGTIEQITDTDYDGVIHSNTSKFSVSTHFMTGFEVTPGIHYYVTPKRIIFMQLQYLRCYRREFVNFSAHMNQSLGLLAGIYF